MVSYQVLLIPQGKLSLVLFYRTSPSLGGLSILNPQKNDMVFEEEKKGAFLSSSTGKLSRLFHHDLLEINVSCNFGGTKNRCNGEPTGNLSCSTLADKEEFSILMNHRNALVEEICSSVRTFVRLCRCKPCIPALKYLSFLFLFVPKTLDGQHGGESRVLSPQVPKAWPLRP